MNTVTIEIGDNLSVVVLIAVITWGIVRGVRR